MRSAGRPVSSSQARLSPRTEVPRTPHRLLSHPRDTSVYRLIYIPKRAERMGTAARYLSRVLAEVQRCAADAYYQGKTVPS